MFYKKLAMKVIFSVPAGAGLTLIFLQWGIHRSCVEAWTGISSTPALLGGAGNQQSFPFLIRSCTNKSQNCLRSCIVQLSSGSNGNKNDENEYDDVDGLGSFKSLPKPPADNTPKLGIEIGKMLEPLSSEEAAELKAAAIEIINDAYAEGLDEIEKLRKRMEKDVQEQQKQMKQKSDYELKEESERLLNRIDSITSEFLSSTSDIRTQTKLAAAADKAAKQSGKGVEWGSWGTVEGANVLTNTAFGSVSLLGSVENSKQQTTDTKDKTDTVNLKENRIIVIADENQDLYAKQILPALTKELQSALPGLEIIVYKPTATFPIGGDNAACVLFFFTSLTDKTTVTSAADRLLRKTISAPGTIAQPPTQLVAISTVGTERIEKMPYSMQNMMSGGKIEKRRQMEETLIRIVRNRAVTPALDYTICKFGEIKSDKKDSFQFSPFDKLDGTTDLTTAVTILSQAIAFQPTARNATFCCIGKLPPVSTDEEKESVQNILDDAFLQLDGPEILRLESTALSDPEQFYDELVEYVREWAFFLAENRKGITTPIRAQTSTSSNILNGSGIEKQEGVQLLFLPTNTGRNYLSKEEEKERREQTGSKSSSPKPVTSRKLVQEGGIAFEVELLNALDPKDDKKIRFRAKRTNYAADAVIKELSEETILNRFKECIDAWKKTNPSKLK